VKVEIDSSRCQGHGSCVLTCSEVFIFDESGYGEVVDPDPPERLRPDLDVAVANCPENAISVVS
jgi:ferredoxin